MKVKTLAQMNAERAAKRTQLDLLESSYIRLRAAKIRKIKKAASRKLQATSAIKKPQMIFKTILEFEKDKT